MTPTRAHRSWPPAAWLALPWLLAACANVLGLEERKVDTATSYPPEGYEGCRAGDCSDCLEVHRTACQVRSTCAAAAENTDCAGCVCRSCEQEVVDCQLDSGCAAIWDCLRETRCDLSERAEDSCLQACASIIEASGGVTGTGFRAAAQIRSCAASSACLSCLAPQVQQSSRACTQANGCLDCEACFEQCLCSGERYGECQRACPTQGSTSTACSEDDACAGCSSCFDACSCGGGSYDACVDQCTTPEDPGNGSNPDPDPDPDPSTCTVETSCADCADCVAQCTCSTGNTVEACEGLCAPQPGTDQCRKDPRGVFSSCDGCQSCIAQCTCEGSSIEYCRSLCQEADCCGTPGACGNGFGECLCTQTGAACYAQQYGNCDSVEPCETCACQQCPGERGMCLEEPGCQRVFDCMRATNCKGSACLDRCRGSDSPQAFAYAEALWACYRGSECSCGTEPPPSVACPTLQGETQCAPYVGNVQLQACCSGGTNTAVEPVGAKQASLLDSTNPCGLQLKAFVRGASACEARDQPAPPRFAERCPDATISEAPYSGAVLKGCCREDSVCGYFDDVTGLGCLSPKIFGQGKSSCP